MKRNYTKSTNKAFQTKIKNKTFTKSKPEDVLYKILVKEFKRKNVIRQRLIYKQHVDFYIVTLDLYIQVDGVYWHGLNKTLKTLKESTKPHEQKIYKQVLRDRKLNKYFKLKKLKMLRISDIKISELLDKIVPVLYKTKFKKIY